MLKALRMSKALKEKAGWSRRVPLRFVRKVFAYNILIIPRQMIVEFNPCFNHSCYKFISGGREILTLHIPIFIIDSMNFLQSVITLSDVMP